MYAATSVDLSRTSPTTVHSMQPAAVAVVDSRCDDETCDDSPRLTAVYAPLKKSSAAAGTGLDDVIGRCPSPALSSNRASPSSNLAGSHYSPGRHRHTLTVSRTLPQTAGSGDGVGGGRQRVSFQATEPLSHSSTCLSLAEARPRGRTDAAVADHHRTSSVDEMRTNRTPDRSPKPPRHDPRTAQIGNCVDFAPRRARDSQSALHNVRNATASPSQLSDIVD